MIHELARLLMSKWKEFGCRGRTPGKFHCVLSGGRHRHSKIVVYCVPDSGEAQPLVVKIQRDDLDLPLLENEYLQLKTLHRFAGLAEMTNSIPNPLFFGELLGRPTLIETYLPGVPFARHSQRRNPRSLLRSFAWLKAFHVRTIRDAGFLAGERIDRYFLYPVESALRDINELQPLAPFLSRFMREVGGLAGLGVPLVFNHNDLCLNNIRFDGEAIRVIDWEFSQYPGLPLFDVINLFLFFTMTWKKLGYREAFILAFAENNDVSSLLKGLVRDYLRDLNFHRSLVGLLIIQYLISRVLLLRSIGSVAGFEDSLWCLAAVARGHVDLDRWGEGWPQL